MKLILRRDLFLNGCRYRRDPYGTEVPDTVDGRKVVLHKDWKEGSNDIPLPRDAELFDPAKPVQVMQYDLLKPTKQKPIALSQMPKPEVPMPPVAKTVKNELI